MISFIEQSIVVVLGAIGTIGPLMVLLGAFVLDVPRNLFMIFGLAVATFRAKLSKVENAAHEPHKVSIVMSIRNGEGGLERNLQSIHEQSLAPVEIIVIDDGSTDSTYALAKKALREKKITHLIHHSVSCGKPASINHAARFATGDLLLIMDDDTLMVPDAIEKLAAAFDDPEVGIASGSLPIRNKHESIWTALQAIEYMVSIEIGRAALDAFNAVPCCSGAFNMVRRDVFMAIGGEMPETADDLDLTLRIHDFGYRARFVPNSVAFVDAPVTLEALFRQRERWDFGSFNIFMLQRKAYKIYSPGEHLSYSLMKIDYVLSDFIPSITFPFYLAWLFYILGPTAVMVLVGIYFVLLPLYMTIYGLCVLISRQDFDLLDLCSIFLMPFYTGVLLKLFRFYSYSEEILFSASFNDTYIPWRVRNALFPRDR
jgi:cellulose synthase/poly-beta-1,6-N-acetylglucosamine synthase-like glycosyltransferase